MILNRDNPLFVGARQGRRQPSAFVAMLSILGAFALIFQRLNAANQTLQSTFPGGTASLTNPLVQATAQMLFQAIVFVPVYAYVWGWLALFCRRSFRTLGFESDRPVSRALRAALVAVLMVTVMTLALAMTPGATLAAGLLAFVVQASAEEVLFGAGYWDRWERAIVRGSPSSPRRFSLASHTR